MLLTPTMAGLRTFPADIDNRPLITCPIRSPDPIRHSASKVEPDTLLAPWLKRLGPTRDV